jgi:hypothetical protein
MKRFLKFWKYAKALVIPAVGAAVPIAAAGVLGPKAQAVAIAATTIWGVFSKRPQDNHDVPPPVEQGEQVEQ